MNHKICTIGERGWAGVVSTNALWLASLVGTNCCAHMISSDQQVHMFVTGDDESQDIKLCGYESSSAHLDILIQDLFICHGGGQIDPASMVVFWSVKNDQFVNINQHCSKECLNIRKLTKSKLKVIRSKTNKDTASWSHKIL